MGLPHDLRYAARALARAPAFTGIVVLLLALGIGATTAMFSIVHGVVLRPLPFPEAERLVRLCETHESVEGFCVVSPPNAADWQREAKGFEQIGLAREWSFFIEAGGAETEVAGALATPEYFAAFRLEPFRGRLLEPADLLPGAPPVVVLSHAFWQRRFGGDPEVVGRPSSLDGEPATIVGILPAELEIPQLESVQVWVPLRFFEEERRRWRGFQAVARLRPEATLAQARSELRLLTERLAQLHPETNAGWGSRVVPLLDWVVGPVRATLWFFLGAVGLVLLIGCVNTANLLLARAVARQREMALRAAIGAPRSDLIRLLLVESLLLALLGGGLGILLAHGLLELFLASAPRGIPRLAEVGIDATVLLFAIVLSVLTSLVFGLVPALRSAKTSLSEALKNAIGDAGVQLRFGIREGLVALEVALAMLLLVSAGLLTRSFLAAAGWRAGFEADRLWVVSVTCPQNKYKQNRQVAELYRQGTEELAALPGVAAAGTASAGAFFGGRETSEFLVAGEAAETARAARWFDVDPGYFEATGVALLQGRGFTDQDTAGAPPVAIVNSRLAQLFWPGQDPLGKRLARARGESVQREVVGVVEDLAPLWPAREVEPEIYWPTHQEPRWATYFVVRAAGDQPGLGEAIENRLHALDPDLALSRVATAEQMLSRRLLRPRFNMMLAGCFAVLALALAVAGTYGVFSYRVARRTREIGLRMALGASRWKIITWVLSEGVKLAGVGIAIGIAAALGLTRWMAGLLYGIGATDAATFGIAAGLLALIALGAVYLPARRAARVQPLSAMRWE